MVNINSAKEMMKMNRWALKFHPMFISLKCQILEISV